MYQIAAGEVALTGQSCKSTAAATIYKPAGPNEALRCFFTGSDDGKVIGQLAKDSLFHCRNDADRIAAVAREVHASLGRRAS